MAAKLSRSKKSKESKLMEWVRRNKILTGAAVAALIVFGLVVPLTAMQFENHNSFCASCHTEGEQTFFDRSIASDPVDLASIHDIKEQARCIDCHTGPGITGRYAGLMAGATDLINYFSGHYPQPAALEEPYPDANCLKCHANISQKQDFNNHFHVFLPQWQKIDKNAATCVSCHLSHDTTGDVKIGFLNEQTTTAVCQKCHSVAGG
ncbi:MAG TPA: cytochrome c3 family protein [Anaerolineales bacterium]|nr:cytochrome c3 family protein [Anaerolineales bacterium]